MDDGEILLAWNDNPKERNPLSVAILNETATGIFRKENLAQNEYNHAYHNMGIIQRKNGNIVILTSSEDIPISYYYFPFGIFYTYQYNVGVQAYITNESLIKNG